MSETSGNGRDGGRGGGQDDPRDGHHGGRTGRYATDQSTVDTRVQEYYSGRTGWDEHARLTVGSVQGRLEHTRTQELIRQRLAPGARVLDVGGATGVHAAPLADDGYDVLLVDPVACQVSEPKSS